MLFFRTNKVSAQEVVRRLFLTEFGRRLVSALFGFSLAILFRRVCKGRDCTIINSPPLKDIERYVYELKKGECYQYTPIVVSCKKELHDQSEFLS